MEETVASGRVLIVKIDLSAKRARHMSASFRLFFAADTGISRLTFIFFVNSSEYGIKHLLTIILRA